ncbi:MAG: tryptophan synthase subunit alpha [Nitrospira sp.]|nr:tryptophan synthase subunit alpha [Candidatus Manganitrophaceae bacterium]HIL35405.1 tryptophan synthase subunit alpha [Candidatus Manganitrophaceae bacterium]
MSRIEAALRKVQAKREKGLIAYVMAGDPSLEESAKIILEIEKGGADLVEIGIPFSDPIADGPTIQKASERALRQGVNVRKVLDLVANLRRQTKIPLILMSYCNPIYAFGIESFFKEAKRAGVDGLIVPDLPPEEAADFILQSRKTCIDQIFLAAPTTPLERLEKIIKVVTGFLYYVPLTGVTGSELKGKNSIGERVRQIKSLTEKPVAVGFGISTPEDAKKIGLEADAVIVGSALVRIIETASSDSDYLLRLSGFVSSLKQALRS